MPEALVIHDRAAKIYRKTLAMNNPERAQPLLSLAAGIARLKVWP